MPLYVRAFAGIALAAQAGFGGFVLEPLVERNFGAIHYDMDFPFPAGEFSEGSDPPGAGAYGRSLLVFPVDVFLAGLRLESGDPEGTGRSLYASAKAGLTQPRRSMVDKDWFELRSSGGTSSATVFVLFSDTESRSRLDWWSGELGQEFPGFHFKGRRIRIGWRLGADYYAADIYGVKGWQGDRIGGIRGENYVEFDTLHNEKVLTYRALYLYPGATAATHWLRGRRTDLDLRLAFSPATFAWDEDYHLLREKRSTAWAIGLDGALEADLVWHAGPLASVKLGGSVRFTRTWGIMTQEFYGNTPEAEEGNRQLDELGGISNSLGRFTYALRISTPLNLSGRRRPDLSRKGQAP